MRKVLLSLFVSLALVLSQQGAFTHELSHLAQDGASQQAEKSSQAEAALCLSCLAFDHLAVIAYPTIAPQPLLATDDFWIADTAFPTRAADAPSERARDPPLA